MSSSEPRSVCQTIEATGLPLLIGGMLLSAGTALYMGAGALFRRLGLEGVACIVSDCVWIGLWVLLGQTVVAGIAIVCFRIAARRLSRPVEIFADGIDAAVRDARIEVPEESGVLELDRLAAAFNRLQGVRRRQSEEIRKVARNVLHDLRTPIANINSEADRLAHELVPPDEAATVVESISRSLLRIIDTNSEITRNLTGRVDRPALPQDLSEVARGAGEMYSAVAETKGIAFATDIPMAPIVVMGHLDKLQRIVGNLLDNAFKFTSEGGQVALRLSADGQNAVLAVSDTGVGIREEDIGLVYERFYRCSATKDHPGSGLGLSMVQSIVALYGGKIDCASTPGKGTTFTVVIPRA